MVGASHFWPAQKHCMQATSNFGSDERVPHVFRKKYHLMWLITPPLWIPPLTVPVLTILIIQYSTKGTRYDIVLTSHLCTFNWTVVAEEKTILWIFQELLCITITNNFILWISAQKVKRISELLVESVNPAFYAIESTWQISKCVTMLLLQN